MKEALHFPVMRIAGTGSSGKASVINWGMKAILLVEKNYPMLPVENLFISFYESEARRSPEAKAEPKLLKERQNRVSKS
ncbi:unnamed protein product [Sphenostylis stenocarpa]|uniref:Uncharacterized protein n=1 Tax=Sphenostylis stenocarpa TaxID=92480 RepID=A0AA87B7S1_9FABA|nr:unnamed protein product [Sphenostylis stenocarpa]